MAMPQRDETIEEIKRLDAPMRVVDAPMCVVDAEVRVFDAPMRVPGFTH